MKSFRQFRKYVALFSSAALAMSLAGFGGGGGGAEPWVEGVPEASFASDDPYYGPGAHGNGQWHLDNSLGYAHINVTGAWEQGYTGKGILIGFVDQGLNANHQDLLDNYKADLDWDFLENDDDPSPAFGFEYQGMGCAGLAAARGGNGLGVTGVAPHAGVASLRMASYDGKWDFATWKASATAAASYLNDVFNVKVYSLDRKYNHNATLGEQFADDSDLVAAIKTSADAGVINIVTVGKSGDEDGNARMAMASRHALVVGAVGHNGLRGDGHAFLPDFWADHASSMFVSAPGTLLASAYGSHPKGLTTTDQKGNSGNNSLGKEYNKKYRAPSAAACIVSGVTALILQANPNLDTRGVKHVLANTSVKTEPDYLDSKGNPGWTTNAAGHDYSIEYGFGIVDATAAVNFAKTYKGPGNEVSFGTGAKAVGAHEEFSIGTRVKRNFTISANAPLETIELRIDMSDSDGAGGNIHWSTYAIYLTSPSGTKATLLTTGNGQVYDKFGMEVGVPVNSWVFSSPAFWGESPVGTWEVEMYHQPARFDDIWESFEFTGYGSSR